MSRTVSMSVVYVHYLLRSLSDAVASLLFFSLHALPTLQAVLGTTEVRYQGNILDFGKPFRRATMHELVKEATSIDFEAFAPDDVDAARGAALNVLPLDARAEAEKIQKASTLGHIMNELFEAVVEETLQQPTFVLDHPIEISPLAKPHRARTGLVERFELFIAGRELANSFSELTDPLDQRSRLEAQVASHKKLIEQNAELKQRGNGNAPESDSKGNEIDSDDSDDNDYEIKVDEDFLMALEYGMPPTGGMGLGIDRLVMLLTDSASIRDVIAFPLMK